MPVRLPYYKLEDYPGIITAMSTLAARRALGAFLRAHRERLGPPPGASGRRRTPGLRREEIAEACGASLTWITWLEQGREVSASPRLLARLAEALRLAPAERAYLFELAGKRDPAALALGEEALPAEVLALPGAMTTPAYLLDGQWTARAWNKAAAKLFVGWLDGDHDRNLLRFIFRSALAPKLIVDWGERARRVVAEFRADFQPAPARSRIERAGRRADTKPRPTSRGCGANRACLGARAASAAFARPRDDFIRRR